MGEKYGLYVAFAHDFYVQLHANAPPNLGGYRQSIGGHPLSYPTIPLR